MIRRKRGAAFLVTLALMAGLVAVVGGLAVSAKSSTRAAANRMQTRRAQAMVESAIERAMAELSAQNPAVVTKRDPWATLGSAGDVQFLVGDDTFRLEIADRSAKLDLNSIDADALKKLPLTDTQADALLDWRDKTTTPRANGAKDEYYNRLPNPYNTKLKTYASVDELLLVKGFTPASVYRSGGSAPALCNVLAADPTSHDKNPQGKAKLDINKATADDLVALGITRQVATSIMQSGGGNYAKLGDLFSKALPPPDAAKLIADFVTVGNDESKKGKLNLNTATEAALMTLPGMQSDVAAAIADRQGATFHGLSELLDVPGCSFALFSSWVDRLCVGSQTFEVRAMGQVGQATVCEEADIVVGDDASAKVVSIRRVPLPEAKARWGWNSAATRQEVVTARW